MAKELVKKATKKEKGGPKRPMSAFFWFLNKRRPQLIAEKPQLKTNVRELGKIAGDEWKAMTPEQKKPYVKMQEDDKKRYESEKNKAK